MITFERKCNLSPDRLGMLTGSCVHAVMYKKGKTKCYWDLVDRKSDEVITGRRHDKNFHNKAIDFGHDIEPKGAELFRDNVCNDLYTDIPFKKYNDILGGSVDGIFWTHGAEEKCVYEHKGTLLKHVFDKRCIGHVEPVYYSQVQLYLLTHGCFQAAFSTTYFNGEDYFFNFTGVRIDEDYLSLMIDRAEIFRIDRDNYVNDKRKI